MKTISILLSSFSVVMCLVLCYFLLFTELLSERLEGTNRSIMIGILIIYAVYRIFRIYKQVKKT